jgi:hypothetical protein
MSAHFGDPAAVTMMMQQILTIYCAAALPHRVVVICVSGTIGHNVSLIPERVLNLGCKKA